ncbi:hypothetical protein SAMN05216236_113100 [Sedimentitalea nanhaiensis]|uniref:Uncharacterized protein n=1 Tax=Sedimentitalea nanhaiensis TaxID=999627 RepID=A0A1I7C1B7_9RHOB|nr:hypothetical protein SAMN05216236_113100 [Sedimentitalea nanhaiensis]
MQPDCINAGRPVRPQNKSYPAGGIHRRQSAPASALDRGQRGVIVAPPSGNTPPPETAEYQVLHKGFDTFAVSIQANIPSDLFDHLEGEKERADKDRQDVLVDYNGVQLHLKAHGGNGYRFIASGGPYGATWFFKKPNTRDKWGIRVSFGSFYLAFFGIAAARQHLDDTLARLGVRFTDDDVSISRVDFCVDVLAPGFDLAPEQFVMHSGANRRDYVTGFDKSVNGKSGRVTSVTIGGPRNRQVIIYDKRREIIASGKDHWWTIWNHSLKRQGLPPLDPNAPENSIWRVEFRAGKDLLKDTWNIRTWAQFYDRFGDLCRHSGEVVRYATPSPTDPNRARWPNHPLWETVCADMNDDLCDMRSGCDPNPMKEVHREQHISVLTRNILGSTITLAALRGIGQEGLETFFSVTAKDLSGMVRKSPEKTAKQLENAKNRYVFLDAR